MNIGKAIILVAPFVLTGCASMGDFGLDEVEQPSKFAAGQVNVSMFNPIPWHEIADEMKPDFGEYTAGTLVDQVAPVVGGDSFLQSRRTSASLSAQVGGAIQNNSSEREVKSEADADGNSTTTSSSTDKESSAKKTPDAITLTPKELTSLIDAAKVTGDITEQGFDPSAKYRGATALFQNLKLLERYTENGPGVETNAYLVRLQITVNPYAHQQPYDIYSHLYFRLKNGKVPSRFSDVRIFPLIISDNLERISTQRINEELQDIQISLAGRGGLFSGAAGFRSALERLRRLVGSDLNNLATYSQVNNTTMQIRFGAPFSAKSGWAMRARTYDIAVVAVLEKEAFSNLPNVTRQTQSSPYANDGRGYARNLDDVELEILVDSNLRHARTGKRVANIAGQDIQELISHVETVLSNPYLYNRYKDSLLRWRRNREASMDAEQLVYQALYGNENASDNVIRSFIDTDMETYRLLHAARGSINQKSVSARIDSCAVPQYPPRQFGALDDNGTTAQLSLVAPKLRSPELFSVSLQAGGNHPLLPYAARFNGTEAQWQFPSLKALGLEFHPTKTKLNLKYNNSFRQQTASNCPVPPATPVSYNLRKIEQPKEK